LRLRPADRVAQLFWDEPQIETELEGMAGHTAKPFRKGLGVAMRTARADFPAASNRIPRRVRPFDFRIVAHISCPVSTKVTRLTGQRLSNAPRRQIEPIETCQHGSLNGRIGCSATLTRNKQCGC